MSTPVRFLPHSIEISTGGDVSAWINQIENFAPDSGVSSFEESTGSATDREFVASKDIAPTLPIVTSDLSFLTNCGMSGLPITSGGDAPGLVAWARELPFGAVPTAIGTGDHVSLSVSDGLLIPVSVRATHNAVAKLSLLLHAILGSSETSGATPFVWAAGQTITSGAGATANIYTVGAVKFTISGGDSTLCDAVVEQGVDFGIGLIKESSDGQVYPTQIGIVARMSKLDFTTKDVSTIAIIGDGISVSGAAWYFRNVAANGQRVAPATTSHIKVSGTAGMIVPGNTTLSHKQSGAQTFHFLPALNTNLLTISIASAIPTS